MIPEIYADGIGAITMSNGVVRLDLVSVTGPEPVPGQRPPAEAHHRIVMSPQAFAQSVRMMQDLMSKLIEAGVVRREPTSTSAPEGEVSPPPAPVQPPSSPNF